MTSHNETQLTREILALSNSQTWFMAKFEWVLEQVYIEDEPNKCLCGHYPIKEICVLRNKYNQNEAVVGNVCVKKFLGLPSDRIINSIKKVTIDRTKSLNKEAIEYMKEKGMLSEWEFKFCIDNIHKRILSSKQEIKRFEINMKIINITKNQYNDRPK